MSLIIRTTGVATILVALALSLNAQTLSLERRIFILSKTYQSLPIQFAHWRTASIKPQQLDSVYRVFLRRTLETDSRRDFALLMREFIALLNNGHSWYNDNKVFGGTLPLGFTWLDIEGKWIVTRTIVDGLVPGDAINSINGKSVDELYASLAKYLSASNERSKRGKLLMTLQAVLPEEITIEFQKKSGSVKRITINRAALKPAPQTQKTESRWLEPGKIAYIKIPSFNKQEFEKDAIEQLKQFAQTPALIVDVRWNGGGSTPEQLTRALMNIPYRWFTESSPLTVGLFRFYTEARPGIELNDYFRNAQLVWQNAENPPDSNAFSGHMIILTNRITGSAAEDFTLPFKDNERATIIGETTDGSTGQPYFFDFGDGIRIGIGTKRVYMPKGGEFEGVGIEPDITVPTEREDLYSGKDKVLERAIAQATKLINAR